MTAAENVCYTLINVPMDSEPPSEISLKNDLEKGDVKSKTEALKKVIIMILNGEKLPGLLMTIIRFVLPLQDHTIKKLLLVFWEIVPKTTPDGRLLHEMILVCDAYRKDLQHPNEFIRGSTLRFLCKLKEAELLEPLMPAIRACLEHRHSYVRRNAVLAIYTIYRNFEHLIPDAPELIHDFLVNEKDASCKRNAFMMLIHADQVCHANPSERARFIRCIYNLLQSSSPAVKYEAAGTLVTLSSAPTAIKDLVMDILRVLSTPDLEVRKKTLQLALDLVSSRNVEELVIVLKKEVIKTNNVSEHEDTDKYRQLLVRTLHSCSVRFPDMAANVIPVLMEFLSDSNEAAAADVLEFVREAIQRFDNLRMLIVEKMLEVFHAIKSSFVAEAMLLMATILHLGKSSLPKKPITDDDVDRISLCLKVLSECSPLMNDIFNKECRQSLSHMLSAKLEEEKLSQKKESEKRNVTVQPDDPISFMQLTAKNEMNCKEDQFQLSLLAAMGNTQRKEAADPLASKLNKIPIVESEIKKEAGELKPEEEITVGPVQKLVTEMGTYATQSALSSSRPTKKEEERPPLRGFLLDGDFFVTQLTGFSDPVYAEAYVHVNQYDIVLDVLVVNQTSDTLQNCTLELATLGDLKLVEKPSPLTLAPHDFANIKANVKVASTENGIIFGNIVYDVSGAASDRNCVVLSDIHIDIMDYIQPATCTDAEFRQMWAEFEWENKVTVNTNIVDLNDYLQHILKSTNMKCLTPEKFSSIEFITNFLQALSGYCGFMAANLYARSIFGEDALANVSIEKPIQQGPEAPVTGHIRIRAKSQVTVAFLRWSLN
ncbi:hypothetical protein Celaphus_00009062 [Cervus elaphus hippelaphus]|uniref:Coatomer subunit beta n=1 Tax=Cervus elaphus hippelaphus TaxID=46360 RepID=A0A212DIN6_CEREH|nr:hypothetical protein Celaphus_00009062 [Cervus elaphus hippelaphus]